MTSLLPTSDVVQLPTRDQHTTYDYEIGRKRRKMSKSGHIKFSEETFYSAPQSTLRFLEDFRAFEDSYPRLVKRKLVVYNETEQLSTVNLLSKDITKSFALKAIEKWGKDFASKVLSSTETGSLYWNIIHHYGSFKNFKAVLEA